MTAVFHEIPAPTSAIGLYQLAFGDEVQLALTVAHEGTHILWPGEDDDFDVENNAMECTGYN